MKIHLIGICGTGMGSLAGLLKAAGHDVRGSDEHVYPPMSTQLASRASRCSRAFARRTWTGSPTRVVVGNVCRKDHVEVLAAAGARHRADFVPVAAGRSVPAGSARRGRRRHARQDHHVVARRPRADRRRPRSVVPHRRRAAELPPVWRLGRGPEFVVEGDEYDTAFFDKGSKFFHYRPQTAILTSVEFDHADIFRDADAVKAAFRKFVTLIPEDGLLVVCAASPGALEVARGARCRVDDLRAARLGRRLDSRSRRARRAGARCWTSRGAASACVASTPSLPGIYNKENLVGVMAAASSLGVDLPAIARAVRRFQGVKRRQEMRGVAAGRDRRRRLRAPPDGDARDGARAEGALRPGQADRRVRAALGDQPARRVPGRVRRRAVGRRRDGAGAALPAREGAGGGALRRRAAGGGSAPRGVPARAHRRRSTRSSTHLAERAAPATPWSSCRRATSAACTTRCCSGSATR